MLPERGIVNRHALDVHPDGIRLDVGVFTPEPIDRLLFIEDLPWLEMRCSVLRHERLGRLVVNWHIFPSSTEFIPDIVVIVADDDDPPYRQAYRSAAIAVSMGNINVR